MRQFTATQVNELLAEHEPPCVSLYQPTHRSHPENQQDPIRYRNLLQEMEASLRKKYPTKKFDVLLARFEALARDEDFWRHRTDALAILASADKFEVFELQRPVAELMVVADSFHLKPLLRIVQSADRYQILCLNREEARLYEGNRDALDPVDLGAMTSTMGAALGEELTPSHQTVSSPGGGVGTLAMRHGQGSRKDDVDGDRDRFFRAIDRDVLEQHSRPSGLPLMLVALAEHHAPFRAVSHNPYLMAEGLTIHPDALSPEQLRVQAWAQVEPRYLERLAKLVDAYQVAKSRQLGSEDIKEVAAAAVAGRIAVLLVEAGRQEPGRIQPDGSVRPGDLADPGTDDLLDDLAELTLRGKGDVVVVPAGRMPGSTGVAASYRF